MLPSLHDCTRLDVLILNTFPACFGFGLIQLRQGWKFSAKSELYQSLLVAIFCRLQISQIGKTFHSMICSIYLWLVFLFVTRTGSCVIRAISCTNKALWRDLWTHADEGRTHMWRSHAIIFRLKMHAHTHNNAACLSKINNTLLTHLQGNKQLCIWKTWKLTIHVVWLCGNQINHRVAADSSRLITVQ